MLLKTGRPQGYPRVIHHIIMDQDGLAESLPRVMVQVGLAESLPRVIQLLNNNPLPRELVMLSEMASCLYALTATREYSMGSLRRQFRGK